MFLRLTISTLERKLLFLFFVISVIYWIIFLSVSGYKSDPLGIYTQIPLIIIPITGGVVGLRKALAWGGLKSVMGKALIGLSVGMIVWGVALGMWTYYFAVGATLPYPSPADYVFIWSPILWICGLIQLSRVVGARFGLRTSRERLVGFVVTAVVAVASYYLLVVLAHGNILSAPGETFMQLFFDYAYTVEILVVIAIVGATFGFSRKYFGGRYKVPVMLLFVGFFVHFLALVFFVRTTADATYFNGNIADMLFAVAVFLESLGIVNLDTRLLANG